MSDDTRNYGSGWAAGREGARGRDSSASRRLLRRIIEVMAGNPDPQQRLDEIVRLIAVNLVAEVCSIYVLRAGEVLELAATEGLAPEAVHRVRMRIGQGLSGTIIATGEVINTNDAQAHPSFVYFPETLEDQYRSFLGVPVLRSGRAVGVLTVQNTVAKRYGEDEVEALQIIASVLAEILASAGLLQRQRSEPASTPEGLRVEGLRLVRGVAVGPAWLHAPRVQIDRLLADDVEAEIVRLEEAIGWLRRSLDELLDRIDLAAGEHREVLETYRMFAHDRGWFRRMREGIESGISAEAAVRRVQNETQLRLGHASDPYLRERLADLDDIANRLLLHLAGRDPQAESEAMPEGSVIVARNLSAADLMAYDQAKIAAIVLEEGSATAHATIVARAFDLPMLGRCDRLMAKTENGDLLAVDADNGQVFLRPGEGVLVNFRRLMKTRQERRLADAGLRDLPCVTRDGVEVGLSINAAFLLDMGEIAAQGADGVGLYRTELAFMARDAFPSLQQQTEYYAEVLRQSGGKPVVFRALDVGSDKPLPYWRVPDEANPAMGWRAARMLLDRPHVLRTQLRALLRATAGGELRLMLPMVTTVAEFRAGKAILDMELDLLERQGLPAPARLELGVMLEVPALYWQLNALFAEVDFVSIGTNDLLQFVFAADRGTPETAERYDCLSPAALRLIRDVAVQGAKAGVKVGVCGEMASRPLEAIVLVALGVRELSVSPSRVNEVKACVRSLDAAGLGAYLEGLLDLPEPSLRRRLYAFARDHGAHVPEAALGAR